MLFVMIAILVFAIPGILFLWQAIDVRSGKKERIRWKSPILLFLALTAVSVVIHIYLNRTYGFPFLQTSMEMMIAMGIIILISGFIILINFIITKTVGKNMPKSLHDPKLAKFFAAGFAVYFFIIFFIATPTGKKVAFVASINQAMEATNLDTMDDFPLVLVNSEKECLRRRACRDTLFSNQYFIKNNTENTQEVQVKIRALNGNNKEMKVIDSNIMTLKPGEMRLVETAETSKDSSIWNQSSFKTDGRIASYQHMLRHRNPE